MELRVRGQVVCNTAPHILQVALSGCGVAFLPEEMTAPYVADGRLVSVMRDWCPRFPGLFAYYPSRRQSSRALGLVIEAIRYKG